MRVLVLNGSPRPDGNTAALISAFAEGAGKAGADVTVFDVCRKQIAGCRGCEYCHSRGGGSCVQKDGMQELYGLLADAEMLVLASPIYYFGLSAQLQAAIHRTYAVGIPAKLKKAAMLLTSGSDNVYDGAVYEYTRICDWMQLENVGIVTAHGGENKSEAKLTEAFDLGCRSV